MEEDKKDENKVQVNDLNTENKDGITLEDKKEGNNKKNKKEERKEKRKRIKEEKRKEAALANPSNTSSNETNNTSENNDNTENKKKRDKGAFTFKNFTVRHDLCGMKVGTDAVLLAGYASMSATSPHDEVWLGNTEFNQEIHINNNDTNNNEIEEGSPRRILEIGCGSGVITLLLADRYKNAIVDSIDIDKGAIKQALYNIHQCPLPSLSSRIRLFHCPAQEFSSPPLSSSSTLSSSPLVSPLPSTVGLVEETRGGGNYEDDTRSVEEKQVNLNSLFKYVPELDSGDSNNDGVYDLVICAPPYFKSDESTDMILKMKNKRRVARHTHTLLMEELAGVAHQLLKKNTGKFRTIFSLPYPADVFQVAAPTKGLKCVEKVHVRDNPGADPVRLMETYIALPSPPTTNDTNNNNNTTTTTTTNDESSANQESVQPTNVQPTPVERDFSIYTASYKEMPLMHRPYTNQYKFLVKDFCIHFLKK